MELFTPGHLLLLAAVAFVLFFGWKQLPDMARSAGRSLRVFRTEIKGLADDDAARATKSALSSATDQPETPATAAPIVAPPAPAPTSADDVAASDAHGQSAG